jgi:hypothetical protein
MLLLAAAAAGCRENRPMADRVELPAADTTMMTDMMRADSMLDTMPGGEMARGSDSAAMRLLRKKQMAEGR